LAPGRGNGKKRERADLSAASSSAFSSPGNVGCPSPTFPSSGQVVAYFLAFRQGAEPCASYTGVVHQEVLPAVVGGYETVPLLLTEPLDPSLSHALKLLSFFYASRWRPSGTTGTSSAARLTAKASNAAVATYPQRSLANTFCWPSSPISSNSWRQSSSDLPLSSRTSATA
jgi:hypothetical protein